MTTPLPEWCDLPVAPDHTIALAAFAAPFRSDRDPSSPPVVARLSPGQRFSVDAQVFEVVIGPDGGVGFVGLD